MAIQVGNPCSLCGCTLQTGTLVVAITEMILCFIFGCYDAIADIIHIEIAAKQNEYVATGVVILLMDLLIYAGSFYLGLLLKRGADQVDYRKCRIWFIATSVIFMLSILLITIAIGRGHEFSTVDHILYPIDIVFRVFSLWIVYAYMNELKSGVHMNSDVEAH